jgi:type I restriction enzyme S subunit
MEFDDLTARNSLGQWDMLRLGDHLKLQNGFAFKPSQWSKRGDPIIRIQNLNQSGATFNSFDGELSDKFRARSGDLLFAWSGTPGTSFGAHVWNGGDAWINQHIFRVEFSSDEFDRDFLRLSLNFNLASYIAQAHGGVGLAHVTKGMLNDSLLVAPPVEVQRRISKVVAKVDGLASDAAQHIAESQAATARLHREIIAGACSGRLTEDWREWGEHALVDPDGITALARRRRQDQLGKRFREPVLNEHVSNDPLPESWDLVPAGLVLESIKYGTSQKCEYGSDGVAVLRIPNVSSGRLELSDLKYAHLSDREREDLTLLPGDLLMIRSNGSPQLVGRAVPVSQNVFKMAYAGYLLRLRVDQAVCTSEYLDLVLKSPGLRRQVEMPLRSTSGINNINTDEVRALGIPLPSIEEQVMIVQRVRSLLDSAMVIDRQIESARHQLGRTLGAVLAKIFNTEPLESVGEPIGLG